MVESPLLTVFLDWADRQSSVKVVTLFGSHAKGTATSSSDVDLQVVTSRPERFETGRWSTELTGCQLHAYAVRAATGGVRKATALFDLGEVDFVIVPLAKLRLARLCVSLGLHRRIPSLGAALAPMAIILRPGHRVLRGGSAWTAFYRRVVDEVSDPRLNNTDVKALADTAYVDTVWIAKKAEQGELIAAQRWLHRTPAEINFRLLNEWRLRRGEPPCFDARRAESVLPTQELEAISISAPLESAALLRAARQSAATTRRLVQELTGKAPDWPAF